MSGNVDVYQSVSLHGGVYIAAAGHLRTGIGAQLTLRALTCDAAAAASGAAPYLSLHGSSTLVTVAQTPQLRGSWVLYDGSSVTLNNSVAMHVGAGEQLSIAGVGTVTVMHSTDSSKLLVDGVLHMAGLHTRRWGAPDIGADVARQRLRTVRGRQQQQQR